MSAKILYAQSLAQQQSTNTGNWADIAGLSLTLPPQSSDAKFALVILNIPNPYAKGNDFPGGAFTIRVNGQIDQQVPIAAFTSYNKVADPGGPSGQSAGRVPTTLVAKVMLAKKTAIALQGAWLSIRGATVIVDTPASISAVLGQ